METTATANNKHSATAGQINIKPSTVVLFTIVLVIEYIISHHKKFQSMLEDEKNTIWREKSSVKTRLRYDTNLESSDREFKMSMINMLRPLMTKVDNIEEQMGNVI